MFIRAKQKKNSALLRLYNKFVGAVSSWIFDAPFFVENGKICDRWFDVTYLKYFEFIMVTYNGKQNHNLRMVVLSYLKIYCSYIKVGVAQNN